MKKIEEKIIGFIKKFELIKQDDKILVALSGGPDSVFLLYFLLKYKKKYKITIGAMHLNHMIRGAEAKSDEKFCRNLCSELGVDYHSANKDVPAYSKKNKISIEEAAREIRYAELEKIQKKFVYNKIATAHNCNDNAETIILNLIKGSGIKGLSGIPIVRENIIRPILSITKVEIFNYLTKNKLKYVVDQTNFSNVYERNFIRNKLIPLIKEKFNPKLEQTLFNSSLILKRHSSVLSYAVRVISGQVAVMNGAKLKIIIDKLIMVDKNIWSDVIKHSIESNFKVQISFNDCLKTISLIPNQKGKIVNLSSGLTALREEKTVLIYGQKTIKDNKAIEIKIGETRRIDHKKLSIHLVDYRSLKYSNSKNIEYIDAAKVSDRFTLRKWEDGDRFYPLGLGGSQKISDFLNNQKVSAIAKREQLVLLNKNIIVWVVSRRIDNRYKVTNKTRKVLQLCLK